jgi:hypothetical protein
MEIESRSGKKISELFDFIIGTSTGGIVSLLMTKPNPLSAKDVYDLYAGEDGRKIFKPKLIRFPLDPVKYPSKNIESVLRNRLGDYNITDAITPVAVTAYDTISRESKFFTSVENKYSNLKMWECARATSSAPTYFEPFAFKDMVCIDGGIFSNNPALFGLIEAEKYYSDKDLEFLVVSIGTGTSVRSISKKQLDRYTILSWASNLFDFVSDGQSDTVDYSMARISDVEKYYRFQIDIDESQSKMDDISKENISNLTNITKCAIIGGWEKNLQSLLGELANESKRFKKDR